MKYDGIEFLDNNEFNRYLLYKYIYQEYIKEGASEQDAENSTQELILKYSNNLFGKDGLAVILGERNFEFFCIYFLQNTFVPKDDNDARNLAKVHLEIWNELQQMFVEDKWDKEEFILPRGCSKSTIINKALSCYVHCYKKSRYTIVIGNKEDDAVQFIDDTKQMIDNPYIVKAFGKLINKKDRTVNKQELELDNNTKIQAFSWGSSVRGTTYGCSEGIFRPSLIICDDILSEEDILSDNAKEKVMNKFYKEVAEVGDTEVIRYGVKIKSSSKFIIIGTPLAQDCFINTIKNDATFRVFHRRVVDFDVDEYFENNSYWQEYKKILFNDRISKDERDILLKNYYLDNIDNMKFETIWEKYRCDKDIAQKYLTKRTAFMQELMCSCENIGDKWFKSIRTLPIKEIEERTFVKTMLCVDPASTTNKKSDYTAMVVGSKSDKDFKYIRHMILRKLSFDDYCKLVVELIKKYTDITHVYIEKNTYSGADLIKIKELIAKDPVLRFRDIKFINEQQSKNKDEKISTQIDPINNGQIIFAEEPEDDDNDNDNDNRKFIKQIKEFQGQHYTLHDDATDITAEFAIRVDEIKVVRKIQVYDIRNLGI